METLETLAQKQIEALPRTPGETQFIKNTIIQRGYVDNGCGGFIGYNYEGWYPKLFYGDPKYCIDPDFIVADVHTNPNHGQILHVGVGKINVIYFTAETCAGPTLYVGPVFSFTFKKV